jgi:hypothetical protein
MGNDISERRLAGAIDNVWFNVLAAPPDAIMALTCVPKPFEVSVDPAVTAPLQPGAAAHYVLSITNTSSDACGPLSAQPFVEIPPGFDLQSQTFSDAIFPGQTLDVSFDIASNEETEPGEYPIEFLVFQAGSFANLSRAAATHVVAAPTGCFARSNRSLMIRDVIVVDDPLRTTFDGPADDPRTGAWSFGGLMRRLAATPADAARITEGMFSTFLETQNVNGFEIQPRSALAPVVLDPWPRDGEGNLDLTRAPMRLLAIVNRLDLHHLPSGKAGEGRFVFGVLDQDGNPLEFTVILEYVLPGSSEADRLSWAQAFHALKALPFPSEAYNAALQAITDGFTARGALPGAPNESALIDIRTNEFAFDFRWQLREFRLDDSGSLVPAPLFQTPDQSFNFTASLASFINQNQASILAETHEAPLFFGGQPFATGAVFNDIDVWDAPGILDNEARHKFSLNTCNGCHGGETNTGFLHVFPRFAGEESSLSGFLLGTTVSDPVTGEPRRLAELSRRRTLLEALVCDP